MGPAPPPAPSMLQMAAVCDPKPHSTESRVSGLTETTNNPSEQVPVQLGDVPSRKKAVTECATRVLKTVKRSAGNLGRFPKDLFPEHKERYQDMNMRFI